MNCPAIKALFKGDLKICAEKHGAELATGNGICTTCAPTPARRATCRQRRQEFAAMQADYAAYAKAHGVLPMPDGYNPT
jgi:hypothetical protein